MQHAEARADACVVLGRRRRSATLLGVLLVVLGTAPAHAGAARAVGSTALAPGLTHEVWSLPGERTSVHVARRDAGSPVRVQLVQAHDALTSGLETTSSMCRRTRGCQIAVNGDFFGADGPVGAVVAEGRMARSPRPNHEQLSLEPLRVTTRGLGEAGWTGSVARDGHEPLLLDGVNVALAADRLVLYTSQYGAATPPCTCVEVALSETGTTAGALGRPAVMTLAGRRSGGTRLTAGAAVLAGAGASGSALEALASAPGQVTVTVAVAAPTRQNVGVHPVLLRDGRPEPYDDADPMLAEAHPRTLVGWNSAGTTWFVTVDGRRAGSHGMTAAKAVAFLRQLGATDAVMLDGGGSTTFVRRGDVVNSPSERQERPVANAVVLSWDPPPAPPPPPPPPPAPLVAEQVAPAVPVVLPAVQPAVVPPPAAAPAAVPAPEAAAPTGPAAASPSAVSSALPTYVASRRPPADDLRLLSRARTSPTPPLPSTPALPSVPPLVALLGAAVCAAALASWLRVVARWPRVRTHYEEVTTEIS